MDMRFQDAEQKINSLNTEIEAQKRRIEDLERDMHNMHAAIAAASREDHKSIRDAMAFVARDFVERIRPRRVY